MMACVIWFVIDTVSVPQGSIWLLTINACIVCSLSFILLYRPQISACAGGGLYLLLETLIGPVIVWILVGSSPANDFIGGAVLLAALIGLFSYRMRQLSKQEAVANDRFNSRRRVAIAWILGLGFGLKRYAGVDDIVWRGLEKLSYWVLMPTLWSP